MIDRLITIFLNDSMQGHALVKIHHDFMFLLQQLFEIKV